jgi:hypothetical protein
MFNFELERRTVSENVLAKYDFKQQRKLPGIESVFSNSNNCRKRTQKAAGKMLFAAPDLIKVESQNILVVSDKSHTFQQL